MTEERKKELREIADAGITNLNLEVSPKRIEDILVLYTEAYKYSNTEIQYMYDYLKDTTDFKRILVLPSNTLVSTMTLDELKRWRGHIDRFLRKVRKEDKNNEQERTQNT